MTINAKPCPSGTPSWFTGHWRDWHRGHGCDRDDGKPRSEAAVAEIVQHEADKSSGHLTDAELIFLRARTTSGDALLVRALAELAERRARDSKPPARVAAEGPASQPLPATRIEDPRQHAYLGAASDVRAYDGCCYICGEPRSRHLA